MKEINTKNILKTFTVLLKRSKQPLVLRRFNSKLYYVFVETKVHFFIKGNGVLSKLGYFISDFLN